MVKLEGKEWKITGAKQGYIAYQDVYLMLTNAMKVYATFGEAIEELPPDAYIKTTAWNIVRDGLITGTVETVRDGFKLQEGGEVRYFNTRAELVKSL